MKFSFYKFLFFTAICLFSILSNSCRSKIQHRKPVIYLYPAQEQEVSVKVALRGTFTITTPAYKNGWNVIAQPGGKIFNPADGKNYAWLFWEAEIPARYKLDEGFVVPGERTAVFLDSILPVLGLNENEKSEFISYWKPLMEKNKFNKISFAGKDYTNNAELQIIPKPDVITRVFMVFKKMDSFEKIRPQKIIPAAPRKGFTVIEWGGANLDENKAVSN